MPPARQLSAPLSGPRGGEAADQQQQADQAGEDRQHADAAYYARLAQLEADPVVGVRSNDFHGDDWIGLKLREASVVRGIGVLPVFAGLIGLLLLVGSLAATWAREGR